jgi:hypothetical protein
VGRARAGRDDLAGTCHRLRGHEMAAPGAAFAGQPGRRAGHRHLGAHQASLRAAAGPDATRRAVPARLQPDPARYHDRSGRGTGARVAGAGLTARHPAQRPAGHPGRARCAHAAAGWQPRRSEHHRPQAGSVPRRRRIRRRARPAPGQPGQPGAVDTTQSRRRGEPADRRQPRPGAGDPGGGGSAPPGADRVLRLPVLRRCAPKKP